MTGLLSDNRLPTHTFSRVMTLLLIKDLSAEGAAYYELDDPFTFLDVLFSTLC